MKNLRECLKDAQQQKIAIGHFNISDIAALLAIFDAARELNLPVIIGLSEGERGFVGVRQAAALVKSLREEYDYPIFINADHTYTLDGIKKAAEAGFDMVIFDGAKLSFEENIKQTKAAAEIARSINPNILVEAEIGYIGSSSKLLDSLPEGALTDESALPSAEMAKKFVTETGIDLIAPAVGNIHGMLKNMPNPRLKINRIREIAEACGVPLVLHGGSGIVDSDFNEAIEAGIRIIHINTEIRVAWRKGIEEAFKADANEVTPYKILASARQEVKKIVINRLKLFNKIAH
ncbi:MAG: class II fructose-bisphosphate aldolase [bacterium]|nr:class II fructose-bisphosphate aldolase [bacterium]